jgi:hypothetical protein
MLRRIALVEPLILGLIAAGVVYVASYPIFLRANPDAQLACYRSPRIFRPAEWVIVRTPLQPCLLKWAEVVGARPQVEWQAWYFAQGISDPMNDVHINVAP